MRADDRKAEHPDERSHKGLRIAMALYADVTHDSRVLREASSLADAGHRVTIYCLGGSLPPNAPYAAVAVRPPESTVVPGSGSPYLEAGSGGRLRRATARVRWLIDYVRGARRWGGQVVAAAGLVDVWHTHDLNALAAVAPIVPRTTAVIYDSHEEFLETGSAVQLPRVARSVLARLERRLVRRSFAVVTVNDGIAEDLRRAYAPRRLIVVRNCSARWPAPATRPTRIRDTFGISDDTPVVLFHGSLTGDRGIERVVEAMARPELARAHLVLLGNGDLVPRLKAAARRPDLAGRLHVHPAVAVGELLDWVASADVGVVLQQPRTRNLRLSTPNKLFECIAAGTPVLASDLQEIRRIVVEEPGGPLGDLCDPEDDDAIAAGLVRLLGESTGDRVAARERCLAAAAATLNWEHEATALVGLYDELAASRAATPVAAKVS